LTEHDDVIKSLLRGAPCLGLALGAASARVGPAWTPGYAYVCFVHIAYHCMPAIMAQVYTI